MRRSLAASYYLLYGKVLKISLRKLLAQRYAELIAQRSRQLGIKQLSAEEILEQVQSFTETMRLPVNDSSLL